MTRGWGGTAESKQRTPRVRWYVWREDRKAKFCPFKTVFLLRISYQIITNDYKPVKIKYFLSLKKKWFQSQENKSYIWLLLMVYLQMFHNKSRKYGFCLLKCYGGVYETVTWSVCTVASQKCEYWGSSGFAEASGHYHVSVKMNCSQFFPIMFTVQLLVLCVSYI